MNNIKYPNIKVKLVGEDGNAFAIIGRCRHAMIRNHLSQAEIDTFTQEATKGDYNHLLCTCMNWFDVE